MEKGSSVMNPSSLEARFASIFMRSLIKINGRSQDSLRSSSSSFASVRAISRRYRRVRFAAYESMARAVGSRRVWSRAVLWRSMMMRRKRAARRSTSERRIRFQNSGPRIHQDCYYSSSERVDHTDEAGLVDLALQASRLRRLVPGGEAMDLQGLLSETGHYIKCLDTQIRVMTSIVGLYSKG